MKNKNSSLDIVTMILSILAGATWMFLGGILVNLLIGKLWPPLVIAIFFGGLALVLILVAWLSTMVRGFTMAPKKNYLLALLVALGIFVTSGLFQTIYASSITIQKSERTSYIFLIDDSGSIADPNRSREAAVRSVMAGCADKTFPFAVYAFTDQCWMISDIQPAAAAATLRLDLRESGLTDIVNALRVVEKDIASGRLAAGSAPRILLVTDGISEETGLREVLNTANNMNINICTIAMPGSDERMLSYIADMSDGVFVSISDISQLPSAMQSIAIGQSDYVRTLLNHREPCNMDWIYSGMRILFLLAIGALFIWIKSLLLRSDDMEASMLVPNLVAVLIGSLCVEVGMNILLLNESAMQIVMCVGLTILLTVMLRSRPGDPGFDLTVDYGGGNDGYGGGYGGYGGGYGGYGGGNDGYGGYGGGNDGYGGYGGENGGYGGGYTPDPNSGDSGSWG